MENVNNILDELKEISPLLSNVEKKECYSVNPDYFNYLHNKIIDRINLLKERARFPKTSVPYQTPLDYFTDLSETIMKEALSMKKTNDSVAEELEAIAPLLSTISKESLYTTPANYFNKIHLPIGEIKKEKEKVVSIKKRSRRFRYAAAAIIIPFVAIGLYTITGKEFMNAKTSNSAKNKVKNLSREEIVNYLKENSVIESVSAPQNTSVDNNEIKSSLKQVSDKEIQQFLKETGESDEI